MQKSVRSLHTPSCAYLSKWSHNQVISMSEKQTKSSVRHLQ